MLALSTRLRFPRTALLAGGAVALVVAAPAGGATAQATKPAPRTIVVTTLSDSGRGSLRSAITLADAGSPGSRPTIKFAVRGIITLASSLPVIYRQVTIGATPVASGAASQATGVPPVVEINCNGKAGLEFAAGSSGSQLLGVAVDNAGGDGITLKARSITLNGDYVGVNLAGGAAGNRGDGVFVAASSSGNLIGLNGKAAVGFVANVISANRGSGLVLSGSSGNTVVSNRIGTNPAGTSALANGGDGILITGRSHGNEIGGTAFVDKATGQANNPTGTKGTVTPVFVVPPLGNLVSGNAGTGIAINAGSRNNVLNGNFVGTTANGDARLGNGGDGVWIEDANHNSLIGCKFVNNPFVYYNVVSGNSGNGLRITDSNSSVVQGNFFGVGANNTAIVSNRRDGILVEGSSRNTQVGGVIPLGNVSAGNGRNGIEVTGRVRGFITFNTFGGLLAFKGAAPNGNDGLLITSTGGDNTVRTNVISGNRRNGIELGGNASGVTVDPDIVGLNTKGNAQLANGGDGVLIDGTAHDNTIGGTTRSVIPQNTLSGNLGYGLAITQQANHNKVFDSYIGTALLGVTALGNGKGGVLIADTANRNSIGNFSSRPSDLISGNRGHGVTLDSGTILNLVVNNYIGLNRLGRPLPNTRSPIRNLGHLNVIRANRT
jgi:parallel beta-helix repeat protein